MSHPGASGCNCRTCHCGLRRISSIDTNATADNLPGPGRLLGLLYASLGEKLERRVGTLADRLGYGPHGTAKAIAQIRLHAQRTIVDMHVAEARAEADGALSKAKLKRLQKKCKALIRYSESATDSTVIAANNLICDISVYDPYVRGLFRAYMAPCSQDDFAPRGHHRYIEEDLDPLLASSRKALIFLNEVELHKIMSEIYVAILPDGLICRDSNIWLHFRKSRLKRFKSLMKEDIALIVLGGRHVVHILQHGVQALSKNMGSKYLRAYLQLIYSLLYCFAALLVDLPVLVDYRLEQDRHQTMQHEFIESLVPELGRVSLAVSASKELSPPLQKTFELLFRSEADELRRHETQTSFRFFIRGRLLKYM